MESLGKEINIGKANYTKYSSRIVWRFSISKNNQLTGTLVSQISLSIWQGTLRKGNALNLLNTFCRGHGRNIFWETPILPEIFSQAILFQIFMEKDI